MPPKGASPPTLTAADSWADIGQYSQALATALRTVALGQPPKAQGAWLSYASIVDEIARLASAKGAIAPAGWQAPVLSSKQLQDFGRLLRDKRNQAGFSRVQLARKAKLSDATIKFIETARHPPSRGTLLRLVAVAELGLRWADTPGHCSGAVPTDATGTSPALSDAELSRFDSRLTLPLMLESLLVLDELRTSQHAVEVTAHGSRRVCSLCGARSEAWTLDPREAVKLPLRHAVPCAGRLTASLFERFPVLSELAHEERRSLRSLTATAIDASLRAIHPEQFYGCRSRPELVAQLARATSETSTPYRAGVGALLLWALALGPCPVEPTDKPYSEPRAHQLAQLVRKRGLARIGETSRLRGVSDAAGWLVDPQAAEPRIEPTSPLPPAESQP